MLLRHLEENVQWATTDEHSLAAKWVFCEWFVTTIMQVWSTNPQSTYVTDWLITLLTVCSLYWISFAWNLQRRKVKTTPCFAPGRFCMTWYTVDSTNWTALACRSYSRPVGNSWLCSNSSFHCHWNCAVKWQLGIAVIMVCPACARYSMSFSGEGLGNRSPCGTTVVR